MPPTTAQWRQLGVLRSLAGRRIFTVDSGQPERKTILLIHGYPTSSWDWAGLWPLLADHRLVAMDLLGFGFSDKPRPHAYPIAEQADLVEALVAELALQGFHVLAHDYGVTVAQELLARQNARPTPQWRSLCFLNGGLFPETHRPRLIQKLLLTPLGPLLARGMTKRRLHHQLAQLFGSGVIDDATMDGFWEVISADDGRRALQQLISYMPQRIVHRERWVGALKESRVPIGVINGAKDPISGAHMVARFVELLGPPFFLRSLEAVGHFPQVEAPGPVAEAYREFLARVAASAG